MIKHLALLLALVFAGVAQGAISVIDVDEVDCTGLTNCESPSIDTTGSNVKAFVAIATSDGTPPNVTGCKWGGSGGTDMTLIAQSGAVQSFLNIEMYVTAAAPADNATAYCTFAAATGEGAMGIVVLAEAGTVGTAVQANGNGNRNVSNNVSTSADMWVLDAIYSVDSATGGPGPGTDQTGQMDIGVDGPVLFLRMSTEPHTDGTAEMGWLLGDGTASNHQWAWIGVPVSMFVGGGSAAPLLLRRRR